MSRTSTSEVSNDIKRIKNDFFRCWDRQHVWRFSTRSRRRVHGYCDPVARTIEIVALPSDPDERDMLLIHEICHAVATGNHGVVWQRRMEKAAATADDLGRTRLALLLRKEIAAYQGAGSVVTDAYASIRAAVAATPNLTFGQLKRWLASEYGLLVSEVCTTFKRTVKVFQDAQREARQRQRRLLQGQGVVKT